VTQVAEWLRPGDAEALCRRALAASGASGASARSTASVLVQAHIDGQAGHGLTRIPSYAEQLLAGKVAGDAIPVAERVAPALLRVDARSGFAYPALDLVLEHLPAIAAETGMAAALVHRSHHLGPAGIHVERFAARGLLALLFTNSPKAISFWGGREPMLGTNPIAFAAPAGEQPPFVLDFATSAALSKVARGRILAAARAGERIPPGWALDAEGRPTEDPAAALEGSMLPIGDAKGAALALMVELMAAALTGSNFGFEASSFFDASGGPPHIGHTVVAFDVERASAGLFGERLETLVAAIEATEGARLPGAGRQERRRLAESEGIAVPAALIRDIEALADGNLANA